MESAGHKCCKFTGETKHKEREKQLEEFQKGQVPFLFVTKQVSSKLAI